MKFYVNMFYPDKIGFPNVYPNDYIGLFTQCETKGEGNWCGYYAFEYYLDTTLLAYYEAESSGLYRPEARIGDVKMHNKHYPKISIGSHMWTYVIEAENVDEAVEKFKNAEWRPLNYSDSNRTVEMEIDDLFLDEYSHATVFINTSTGSYLYEDEDIDYIPDSLLQKIVQERPTFKVKNKTIVVELPI